MPELLVVRVSTWSSSLSPQWDQCRLLSAKAPLAVHRAYRSLGYRFMPLSVWLEAKSRPYFSLSKMLGNAKLVLDGSSQDLWHLSHRWTAARAPLPLTHWCRCSRGSTPIPSFTPVLVIQRVQGLPALPRADWRVFPSSSRHPPHTPPLVDSHTIIRVKFISTEELLTLPVWLVWDQLSHGDRHRCLTVGLCALCVQHREQAVYFPRLVCPFLSGKLKHTTYINVR